MKQEILQDLKLTTMGINLMHNASVDFFLPFSSYSNCPNITVELSPIGAILFLTILNFKYLLFSPNKSFRFKKNFFTEISNKLSMMLTQTPRCTFKTIKRKRNS
ncbi:hypothetical protein PGB90_003484 [Kerria lacca]